MTWVRDKNEVKHINFLLRCHFEDCRLFSRNVGMTTKKFNDAPNHNNPCHFDWNPMGFIG